jgi:hypothetical protein
MVHAALLLLMLEAANARPRFTISLKRSTQNLQLSTSSPADYPIFRSEADMNLQARPAASVATDPSRKWNVQRSSVFLRVIRERQGDLSANGDKILGYRRFDRNLRAE